MNESLETIRAMARDHLSMKARVGYVFLLLAATTMVVIVVSLWVTEAHLPARTQLAFGAMTGIGASWVALAAWVLGSRRPLYAVDRVIAGRLAVTFTTVFIVGALMGLLGGGGSAAAAAVGMGVVMLGAAIAALRSARRRFAALSARRLELERALA